jgi:hypothetical protein
MKTDRERLIERLRSVEDTVSLVRRSIESNNADPMDGDWIRSAFSDLLTAFQYYTLITCKR